MRKLNNILEQGLKDQRFTLSDGERERLWESISYTLSKEGADVAAKPSKGTVWWKKPIYWLPGAVAAAAVLGLIMFKPTTQIVTPAASGSGVVAQKSPFQPKAEPMEKTTLATSMDKAADRNGATTSASIVEEEDIRTAEENSKTEEVAGVTEYVVAIEEAVEETPKETPKSTPKEAPKETPKETAKKAKKVKEWEIGGKSKFMAQNSNYSIGASSNITNRGKLSSANSKTMRAMVSQLGYNEFRSASSAPQITPLSESSYSMPFNFALSFTYRVTDNLWLGTGVTYTYLHSKYDGIFEGTTFRIKQGIHFVGVPVNLYYSVLNNNRWDFYVNGGGVVEKGVRAHYDMRTSAGQSRKANSRVSGLQYSLNAGMGVEYKIGNGQFGIYAEPRAAYYFDSKTPKSVRTDEPFQFEVQLGVRFHLK